MSEITGARDPFVGLNAHMRAQARKTAPPGCTVGTVIKAEPLVVRADGYDLDGDDLLVAEHLTATWREPLTELNWPLTARLPRKRFFGICKVPTQGGYMECECYVDRPEETVSGETAEAAAVTHGPAFAVGDKVLLQPSPDGQIYYLLERLVRP